jgi:hypothetical protein
MKALSLKKVASVLTGVVAVAIVVRELTAATHAIGANIKKIKALWKS